jgi:serine O-acetyltransferase
MQCYLDDMHPDRMIVEDDVTISFRVTAACHGPRSCDNRLILREGCYIGCNATLLGGLPRGDIEIGAYATVGACSLVNRSVPPLATAIGIPAKIVRTVRTPWGADDDKTEALARKYLAEPALRPRINPSCGQFNEPVSVTMESGGGDSVFIHYTIDGSEPTEDSTRYNALFRIDQTTVIKARAFKGGHLPSEVISATITIL